MPSLQAKYLLLFVSSFSLGSGSYSGSRAPYMLTASAPVTDLELDLGSDSAANVRAYGSDSEHHAIALDLWDVGMVGAEKSRMSGSWFEGGWHGLTDIVHLWSN